eukprot:m.51407 g.51407  ORF g.51407 m.51407 type:complete len:585 (+) comp6609_c0_seq1:132-1886(+)
MGVLDRVAEVSRSFQRIADQLDDNGDKHRQPASPVIAIAGADLLPAWRPPSAELFEDSGLDETRPRSPSRSRPEAQPPHKLRAAQIVQDPPYHDSPPPRRRPASDTADGANGRSSPALPSTSQHIPLHTVAAVPVAHTAGVRLRATPSRREHDAATVIQATWRGFRARAADPRCASARREIRTRRLERYVWSLELEMESCRQQLLRQEELRSLQQEAMRLMWAELTELRDTVQQRQRADRTRAALTIQTWWRGVAARKKYGRELHGRILDALPPTGRMLAGASSGDREMLVRLCLHLHDQVERLSETVASLTSSSAWAAASGTRNAAASPEMQTATLASTEHLTSVPVHMDAPVAAPAEVVSPPAASASVPASAPEPMPMGAGSALKQSGDHAATSVEALPQEPAALSAPAPASAPANQFQSSRDFLEEIRRQQAAILQQFPPTFSFSTASDPPEMTSLQAPPPTRATNFAVASFTPAVPHASEDGGGSQQLPPPPAAFADPATAAASSSSAPADVVHSVSAPASEPTTPYDPLAFFSLSQPARSTGTVAPGSLADAPAASLVPAATFGLSNDASYHHTGTFTL